MVVEEVVLGGVDQRRRAACSARRWRAQRVSAAPEIPDLQHRPRRAPGTRSGLTSVLDRQPLDKHACHVVKNRVRDLREAKGLSQGELAQDLGVSRQTINSIEVGRYTPSLPLALTLARYFGLRVEEMFDDSDG